MPRKSKTDALGSEFFVLSLNKVPPVEFASSGVPEIDDMTGGGYPRGRVTQIYGLSAVGKTTMMIKCLAVMSLGERVLYIDTESALNVARVAELGGKLESIDYTNIAVLEDVTELIRKSVGKYDVIVLDSVAMLVPRAERAGEAGEAHVGLKPRLLGQWLRQITKDLADTRCALVLVNQMRKSMELYGEKFVLPGGMQLKFSSSLMLRLHTASKDKIYDKEGGIAGHWVHVTIEKNKIGKPYQTTKFKIMY